MTDAATATATARPTAGDLVRITRLVVSARMLAQWVASTPVLVDGRYAYHVPECAMEKAMNAPYMLFTALFLSLVSLGVGLSIFTNHSNPGLSRGYRIGCALVFLVSLPAVLYVLAVVTRAQT